MISPDELERAVVSRACDLYQKNSTIVLKQIQALEEENSLQSKAILAMLKNEVSPKCHLTSRCGISYDMIQSSMIESTRSCLDIAKFLLNFDLPDGARNAFEKIVLVASSSKKITEIPDAYMDLIEQIDDVPNISLSFIPKIFREQLCDAIRRRRAEKTEEFIKKLFE